MENRPFTKVSQTFDERTNERVILMDYRVRRGGDAVNPDGERLGVGPV
jgi:hypothetical protein